MATTALVRARLRVALAIFFVAAGAYHFVNPDFYMQIMPPQVPAPRTMVLLSGALEIVGGIGVLIPRVRTAAGWGLISLLVAIFPANIFMALNPERFSGVPVVVLYLRLPLQVLLMAWVRVATSGPRCGRRWVIGVRGRPDRTT